MKKSTITIVLTSALILVGAATSHIIQASAPNGPDPYQLEAVPYEGQISKVMRGESGSSLLVDSIGSNEYSKMMSILYPNGIVDAQGQEVPGIDNLVEVRERFIEEHMRALSLVGSTPIEIEKTPFTISIADESNGEYKSLFYKASIGKDTFVFPSEWGNQPFDFVSDSEKNIYIIYTDAGIWKIDPIALSAKKITADTYSGKDRQQIGQELTKLHPDAYLLWVSSVMISPDGKQVVYRTNRDSTRLDETSIWAIDLDSGKESQLVPPSVNNDILGFISDRDVVVGALADTRAIDVYDKSIIALDVPKVPNLRISAVQDGKIVISSHEEGSSTSTATVSSVDLSKGILTEISEISGYLDGEPRFSPSGTQVAIGYGDDPSVGVEDVMMVELSTKTQKLLSSSLQNKRSVKGNIIRFQWLNDETAVVETQTGSSFSSAVVNSTEK
ncbi:hypothetical protein ACTHPH_05780 [Paenibacillus pasadenensis]|uniref:Uncharacterized protein n=1 Tax=Paenibacillus pasadenensis TaxID=217090 RepID=A0A2N5NCX3_9BACL|nr:MULTISPECIES: hypothetical protein [Paenibacillus]PLT48199.1 hypothetical protein B8V81_0331 [Paenibacillus pasadenensis]QGG58292.1 hypothetical protein GE073_23745 [Paenibacillus sp. B01]